MKESTERFLKGRIVLLESDLAAVELKLEKFNNDAKKEEAKKEKLETEIREVKEQLYGKPEPEAVKADVSNDGDDNEQS